jgi:membrane protease subunit HflK
VTLHEDIRHIFQQIRPLLITGLAVLLPALYVLSGFYSVGTEERGVILRFGKLVDDQVLPGMHYHWPWPVESVRTVPATTLRTLELDFSNSAPPQLQPELTTGDEDLVDLALLVQYTIGSPGRYLDSAKAPEALLEELTRAHTIAYIGAHAIDPLLTVGRTRLQNQLTLDLQRSVESLALGLRVTSVQLRRLEPPPSIKAAFDDVARARSEKQKLIQESAGERNTQLARARSDISALRANAQAQATENLERARGYQERFIANWQAYQEAPALSRQRLYLENLEALLGEMQVTVLTP